MSALFKNSILILVSCCLLKNSYQDVAHLFAQAPDFNYYQNHHPLFAQHTQFQIPFQAGVSALYAPPSIAVETVGSHPKPVVSPEIVTPAPGSVSSSSSELTLPEIIENRSIRDRKKFIPLLKQYLPPDQIDENASQGHPQHDPFSEGYIYQKPTTTSKPSNPVIMSDAPEIILPINNDPVILPPISNGSNEGTALPASTHGYNYNASSTPNLVTADTPFSQPAAGYLPPAKDHSHSVVPLRLQVHEMRCMQQQAKTNGYLKAVIKIDSFLVATPSVDNDSSDKRCEVKLYKSYIVVDITGEDFTRCGVQQCGTDVCLRLRFPAIRGLRTNSDNILTLHCKTQSRVAVKTHAVKIGVASDVQTRSIGTYAKGGTQNFFRTHVELLRKTPQGYARLLKTNGAVQLGEDLLLRAHVLTGDGWSYTKLTDVRLQRVSTSGDILHNAQLITSQGCLNPSMKSICTQAPTFDAPLGHKLSFKAVMFQGMRSGDELIMSMRITGCLEQHDCDVNWQQCSNYSSMATSKRRKRELFNATAHNNTEASQISRISFKIVMPKDSTVDANFPTENLKIQFMSLILFSSLGFVVLLMCLGIFVLIKFRKY